MKKLHGHTKITLTDVNTGEVEVIEKDNVVTNWVENIYNHNLLNLMDYDKLFPMINFFNGVICINTPVTEVDENCRMIPAGSEVVAHAGNTPYTGDDPTAGNPNSVNTTYIVRDGRKVGVNFSFDFNTNQGNGIWNGICLTHGDLGRLGRNTVDADLPPIIKLSNSIYSASNTAESDDLFGKAALIDYKDNLLIECNCEYDITFAVIDIYIYDLVSLNKRLLAGTVRKDDCLLRKIHSIENINFIDPDWDPTKEEYPKHVYKGFSLQLVGDDIVIAAPIIDPRGDSILTIIRFNKFTGERTAQGVIYDKDGLGKLDPRFSFFDLDKDLDSRTEKYRLNAVPIIGDFIYVPASARGCWKLRLDDLTDHEFIPNYITGLDAKIITESGNVIGSDNSYINEEKKTNNTTINKYYFNNSNNTKFGGGVDLGGGVYFVRTNSYFEYVTKYFLAIAQDYISTINLLDVPVNKTVDKTARIQYTIEEVDD